MKRLALLIGCLIFSLGTAVANEGKTPPKLATSHYEFYGDAKNLGEIGGYLEKFYPLMKKVLTFGLPRKKFKIVVMSSKAGYQKASTTSTTASSSGIAALSEDGVIIITSDCPRWKFYSELYYHCVRQALQKATPNMPVWLREGLSEYFAGTLHNFRTKAVQTGRLRYKFISRLQKANEKGTIPPLVDFFDLPEKRFFEAKKKDLHRAYSWLVVNYLLKKKKGQLKKLLRRIYSKRRVYYNHILGSYSKLEKATSRQLDKIYRKSGEVEYQKGLAHHKKKEIFKALQAFSKTLITHPHHVGARFRRAMIHYNRKSVDAALKDFDYLVEMGLDHSLPYYYRAKIHWNRGYREKATFNIQRAKKISPKDKKILVLYKDIHRKGPKKPKK